MLLRLAATANGVPLPKFHVNCDRVDELISRMNSVVNDCIFYPLKIFHLDFLGESLVIRNL